MDGSGEMGKNRNKATIRKTKAVAERAALRMSIS